MTQQSLVISTIDMSLQAGPHLQLTIYLLRLNKLPLHITHNEIEDHQTGIDRKFVVKVCLEGASVILKLLLLL